MCSSRVSILGEFKIFIIGIIINHKYFTKNYYNLEECKFNKNAKTKSKDLVLRAFWNKSITMS